jgi:hypothetical protein
MRFRVVALSVLMGSRWAEPIELPRPASWVPASADLIVYVDWSALLSSPSLSELESSVLEGEHRAQIEKFRELTGMDPLHDVWALVYFTTPGEDAGPQWGVAGYGAFDPERVVENIQAHGRVARSDYRETVLHAVSALPPRLGDLAGEGVLAFPDSTTLLYGSAEQVRAMLDTGFGFAPPASEESELAGALGELTAGETFWAVGKGDDDVADRVGGAAQRGLGSLPPFASFSLSARLGSKVRVRARAETADAEAATRVAEMVRALAAMTSFQQQPDESLSEIFESLEVETLDELVEISFEVDADSVRSYLRSQRGDEEKGHAR